MAQVECAELDIGSSGPKESMKDSDLPTKKQLKQVRLPFKPLEQTTLSTQEACITPPGSKKRRLSGNDTPSPKIAKTNKPTQMIRQPSTDCDHEVSSSSEAEAVPYVGHHKGKTNKNNTLDRFVKHTSPEEISSTNECVAIDLTTEEEEMDTEKAETNESLDEVKKETDKDQSSVEGDKDVKSLSKDIPVESSSELKDSKEVKVKTVIKQLDLSMCDSASEDKENVACSSGERTQSIDQSFEADPSVCEAALATPGKRKLSDSSEQPSKKECKVVEEEGKLEGEKLANKILDVSNMSSPATPKQPNPVSNSGTTPKASSSSSKGAPKILEMLSKAPVAPVKSASLPAVLSSPSVNSPKTVGTTPQKTPTQTGCGEAVVGTPVSQSPGSSCSDATTPATGKKPRSRLSETKRKEKEAERQKIKEQREKEREEKRLQKEKEKEEKEKERQEKLRQKEQEKAEKEKQKQEEKEKKEKERLEKLQQKEEEKRKKQELVEEEEKEEKKKQEEDKRREEEEKLKKQEKAKAQFQGFFVKKQNAASPPKPKADGLFKAFEVKKDMTMASVGKEALVGDKKSQFEEMLDTQDWKSLYLEELKSGKAVPAKRGKTIESKDDDIELISHDPDALKASTYRAKYLLFEENRRPPYYGTFRKKSKVLNPRNPFKQDTKLFDYEVDSDDEWESEPEDGDDVDISDHEDEEEKQEEIDEEMDGWMVNHGYLSDDEGILDEEDDTTPEIQKIRQEAVAQAWERELKKQTKPLLKIAIGCVWDDQTTNIAAQQLQKLLQFKAVCLKPGPVCTSYTPRVVDDSRQSEGDRPTTSTPIASRGSWLKKSVPEEAMPDLIRLVHGNVVGIKNLIKEFRMYWKLKSSGDLEKHMALDTSLDVDDDNNEDDAAKSPSENKANTSAAKVEDADDFSISKRQLEKKIMAIGVREKRDANKKVCWYVNDEVLKQYGMDDIALPNSWEFVTRPKKPVVKPTPLEPPAGRVTPTPVCNIKNFAQPMSLSEIQAAGSKSIVKEKEPTDETNVAVVTGQTPVVAMEVVTEVTSTSGAKAALNDQRSIMNFMNYAKNLASQAKSKVDAFNTSSAQSIVMGTGQPSDSDSDLAIPCIKPIMPANRKVNFPQDKAINQSLEQRGTPPGSKLALWQGKPVSTNSNTTPTTAANPVKRITPVLISALSKPPARFMGPSEASARSADLPQAGIHNKTLTSPTRITPVMIAPVSKPSASNSSPSTAPRPVSAMPSSSGPSSVVTSTLKSPPPQAKKQMTPVVERMEVDEVIVLD